MRSSVLLELVNNTALLMTLAIVYEVSYFFPPKYKNKIPYLNGFFIMFIGLAVMTIPFTFFAGVVIDTRTILVSVTALTFGFIPSLMTAAATIAYRFYLGGIGALSGSLGILLSAVIGLLWRKYFYTKDVKFRWFNLYCFGLVVHLSMLSTMFLMPWDTAMQVVKEIGLPVMLIHPLGTVLLSLLLIYQKERNESLIELAEAKELNRSLFDNNISAMIIFDPSNGQIVNANPAACAFYGWDMDTLCSMNLMDINGLQPDQIRELAGMILRDEPKQYRVKHKNAKNRLVDVEIYSGPVKMNQDIYIYSIIHDITDRVAADRALINSENRFRMLVEGAPEAIFIITDFKFSFVNQYAVILFGAQYPDQLLDLPLSLFIDADEYDKIHNDFVALDDRNSAGTPTETIFLTIDGTPIPVECAAVPVLYNNRNASVVFARDISERKNLENSKLQLEAQLRQQQKLEAIGTLAGGVAHEINNPINGIMNYAQLILDVMDDPEEQELYAREIIHETERISTIVRSLLQFSRQEKQSHSIASVYDIVNQTVSLIKTIIKKDQIILNIDLDKDLPPIRCRSQQIQQVLMNLLTNARDSLNEKYAEYNEDKIISINCHRFIENDIEWVCLIIEDHGNGIPKDIYEKIYEPFFSTKPKDKGTGLGLSISFGIVKDHCGRIHFESKEGKYTKFMIDLPADNQWSL